ncbi:hypothetical protein L6452_38721 [Arctium lappa]|uniref:Uncharacterized protein n=1 Tax=Arctium lappa TaxID=4217 RepID=A0ACB8XQB2_ARCLA|nr:hypothetical protein L6452_38721 [Arctium lappa]
MELDRGRRYGFLDAGQWLISTPFELWRSCGSKVDLFPVGLELFVYSMPLPGLVGDAIWVSESRSTMPLARGECSELFGVIF